MAHRRDGGGSVSERIPEVHHVLVLTVCQLCSVFLLQGTAFISSRPQHECISTEQAAKLRLPSLRRKMVVTARTQTRMVTAGH